MLLVFREREREKKNTNKPLMFESNVDWLPPIGTHSLGVCPDLQPSGAGDDAQRERHAGQGSKQAFYTPRCCSSLLFTLLALVY